MNKEMMTDAIISAKVKQKLTWEGIAGSIGLSRHE
jgi:cyanate lyase